jgi:hypothetical protein
MTIKERDMAYAVWGGELRNVHEERWAHNVGVMPDAVRATDVSADLDQGPDWQAEQAPVLVPDAGLPEEHRSWDEVEDCEYDGRGERRVIEVDTAKILR